MPCHDFREEYRTEYIENPETKARLDKVTRLLCGVCKKLKNQEVFNHMLANNKELATWWEEHQEADRKREAREKRDRALKRKQREEAREKKALIAAARAKLTPSERKALNL